jgi:hypothetical protein
MTTKSVTHLAGIITTAGWEDNFKYPWHPCLMPVGRNYLAVEYAAMCAVYAGCDTIWIITEPHMQKILKKRLGDYIPDITNIQMDGKPNWDLKKEIPVFYVPIPDKYANKRDSYDWCMMAGALIVDKVSHRISKHVVPEKYLFISPYLITPEIYFTKSRSTFNDFKQVEFRIKGVHSSPPPFFAYMPFTRSIEQIKELKKDFDNDLKEMYFNKLTIAQIKSNLKDRRLFIPLDDDECSVVECNTSWEIYNWQDYVDYMGSFKADSINTPKSLSSARKWKRFTCEELRKENYTLKENNDGTEEVESKIC